MKKTLTCLLFSASALLFASSCGNRSHHGGGASDDVDSPSEAIEDESIVRNIEKHEVVLLKGETFNDVQKKFLQAVNAPPQEWLEPGDTIDVADTVTQEAVRIIIKAKFGSR